MKYGIRLGDLALALHKLAQGGDDDLVDLLSC